MPASIPASLQRLRPSIAFSNASGHAAHLVVRRGIRRVDGDVNAPQPRLGELLDVLVVEQQAVAEHQRDGLVLVHPLDQLVDVRPQQRLAAGEDDASRRPSCSDSRITRFQSSVRKLGVVRVFCGARRCSGRSSPGIGGDLQGADGRLWMAVKLQRKPAAEQFHRRLRREPAADMKCR